MPIVPHMPLFLTQARATPTPQQRPLGVCTAKAVSSIPSARCWRLASVQVCASSAQSHAGARRRAACTPRMHAATEGSTGSTPTGVLFVCLGNICRSPTAEATFRALAERAGRADEFDIDSCGTGGGSSSWYETGGFSYHEGESADRRMTAAASKRGVKLTSISRPLKPSDFERFQYVIAMDEKNRADISTAVAHWAADPSIALSESCLSQVQLMTEYCTRHEAKVVPDPYYGGADGFEKVLDLLDDACDGLLKSL